MLNFINCPMIFEKISFKKGREIKKQKGRKNVFILSRQMVINDLTLENTNIRIKKSNSEDNGKLERNILESYWGRNQGPKTQSDVRKQNSFMISSFSVGEHKPGRLFSIAQSPHFRKEMNTLEIQSRRTKD